MGSLFGKNGKMKNKQGKPLLAAGMAATGDAMLRQIPPEGVLQGGKQRLLTMEEAAAQKKKRGQGSGTSTALGSAVMGL